MLDLLITLGPLFSINRLVGKDRLLRFEHWLLEKLRNVLIWWQQTGFLALRLLPLLVLQIVLALPDSAEVFVRLFKPEWNDPLQEVQHGDPVVGLALIVARYFLAIKTARFMARTVHKRVNQIASEWRTRFGNEPPIEYTALEGPYRFWRSWWWAYFFPFHVIKRFIIIPVWLAIATLAFAPIWIAETIRVKLNPKNDSYIDIIAYGISVAAMLRRVAQMSGFAA